MRLPHASNACFETGFGLVSGFEEGYMKSRKFSKYPKIDKVVEGGRFPHFGL
jgi:hypothetical protein